MSDTIFLGAIDPISLATEPPAFRSAMVNVSSLAPNRAVPMHGYRDIRRSRWTVGSELVELEMNVAIVRREADRETPTSATNAASVQPMSSGQSAERLLSIGDVREMLRAQATAATQRRTTLRAAENALDARFLADLRVASDSDE